MKSILHQYRLRLTNLSQANRSLKLPRLSGRQDIDLKSLDFIGKKSAEEILAKIINGRDVNLLRKLDPRDEKNAIVDRRLNKIYRNVKSIYDESGAYDLFLGYPFVEGKFIDGNVARCPLVLFPVKLIRNLGGKVRWKLEINDDEDILYNPTFFLAYEKFQQLRLPETFWENVPDHADDIQVFLNQLYEQLKLHELAIDFNSDLFKFHLSYFEEKNKDRLDFLPQGKLKLQPNAVLGIFPQSDSALLQDYERIEELGFEEELDALLSGTPDLLVKDKEIAESERFFVAPVDQSQEEALLKVKSGHSLVLHGPPGTGKSQVILNLVSDALATGKRVLVVSQKRAALDVVFRRLAENGIKPFAALIHDFRSDRKKIYANILSLIDGIDQFQNDLKDLKLTKWEHDIRRQAVEIDKNTRFFENLFQAQTDSSRFGLSSHELYLLAIKGKNLFDLRKESSTWNSDKLDGFLRKLSEVFEYKEYFKAGFLWSDRLSFANYGISDKHRIAERINSLPQDWEVLSKLLKFADIQPERYLNPKNNTELIRQHQEWKEKLGHPKRTSDLAILAAAELPVKSTRQILDTFHKHILKFRKFEILTHNEWKNYLDLKEHFKTYETKSGKFFRRLSLPYLKAWWYIKEILKMQGRELSDENIRILKKEVKELDLLMKYYHKHESNRFFKDLPLTDSVEIMLAWQQEKQAAIVLHIEISSSEIPRHLIPQFTKNDLEKDHWGIACRWIEDLNRFNNELNIKRASWKSILSDSQIAQQQHGIIQPETESDYLVPLTDVLKSSFEDLRALDQLMNEWGADEKRVFAKIVPAFSNDAFQTADLLLEKVKQSFYQAWIEQLETQYPSLLEVSSRRMVGRQKDYREWITQRQKQTAELIVRKVKGQIIDRIQYNRLKNPVTYRDIRHQVNKKRRIWPVRKFVKEFWDEGLSELAPCWLASPESVAAIFPMQKDYFDLVIFDEASQCYVERALPVMLRGKQVVIAGDDQQLQPLDLYNVKITEDDSIEVENEMAVEVESALDLAKNVFYESKLNWHYRSMEEELINFSNHAFYGGRLNIIPPANHNPDFFPPIEMIKVEGIWTSNSNRKEAEKVIELIEKLVMLESKPTIGIVTFNYHQQELIRDLLDEKVQELLMSGEQEKLRRFWEAMEREDQEERQGIFVKNIENVQGDERDVIIFSVAYARNEKGKMVSQFGLLNRHGGANRLNVAITRAKQKVYVVTSIDPEELEVEHFLHNGPKLFKKFLAFARAVSNNNKEEINHILEEITPDEVRENREEFGQNVIFAKNILAEKLANSLESAGWELEHNVGDTNYKVDLAVRSKQNPNDFVLGIECEGSNYFSGKSAKEREVYRPDLLEQRGWKMYRLWARNYYLNPESETQKILALLSGKATDSIH